MTRKTPGFIGLYLLTSVLLVAVLSPFVVVALGSFLNTSFLGMTSESWLPASHTLVDFHGFGYVWGLYHESLFFSLKLAVLASLLALLLGVPGGYALAERSFPGAGVLESVVMLPLSLPGVALSIGLIQAFAIIRGRWWLILAGHLLYTLPFMARLVINTLRGANLPEIEACARTLGASFPQRFWLVVVPSLRHTMVIGSLIVFAVSWGEFNVSYLLNTPIHQTYPAALFGTYTSNSFQIASAATVLFLAVLVPVFFIIQWLGAGRTQTAEQGA